MPDVLGVPRGPDAHRPHYDYEETRTYCGECYEQWPCTAHRQGTENAENAARMNGGAG